MVYFPKKGSENNPILFDLILDFIFLIYDPLGKKILQKHRSCNTLGVTRFRTPSTCDYAVHNKVFLLLHSVWVADIKYI